MTYGELTAAADFLPEGRLLRLGAAFLPTAIRSRLAPSFPDAAPRFRVAAAFRPADVTIDQLLCRLGLRDVSMGFTRIARIDQFHNRQWLMIRIRRWSPTWLRALMRKPRAELLEKRLRNHKAYRRISSILRWLVFGLVHGCLTTRSPRYPSKASKLSAE